MSDRRMFQPDRALQQAFLQTKRSLRQIQMRATWSSSVGFASTGFDGDAVTVQDIGDPSYPGAEKMTMLSLTVDPGRWVFSMRLTADMFYLGPSQTMEYGTDFVVTGVATRTVVSPFYVAQPRQKTHQMVISATSDDPISTQIIAYAGATPVWTSTSYDLLEASIIAYPG